MPEDTQRSLPPFPRRRRDLIRIIISIHLGRNIPQILIQHKGKFKGKDKHKDKCKGKGKPCMDSRQPPSPSLLNSLMTLRVET